METDPEGWEFQPDGQNLSTTCNTQKDFFKIVEEWWLPSTLPPKERGEDFLPATYTEKLSQKFMIKKFIKDEDLVNKVFRDARTLFAITVYTIEAQEKIEPFLKGVVDGGIRDDKLPMSKTEIRARAHRIFDETSDFHQIAVKQFYGNQKIFCLPHFKETTHRNYSNSEWGMPLHVHEPIGNGAFGYVYKVKIHPDQDGIGKAPYYAMKVYRPESSNLGRGNESFKRERDFFKDDKMQIKHGHIVNPLTSWEYGGGCYMLFPLAKSDLLTYMNRLRRCDGKIVRNVLKQLYGLSSGIAEIHTEKTEKSEPVSHLDPTPSSLPKRSGYHMDIKPENILVFEANDGESQILKWSDFGCAKFEDWALRSGLIQSHQTRNKMGNLTYQAPEAYPSGKCGRKSDVWSMGAVFLEVVVWLIYGPQGLESFRNGRTRCVSLHGTPPTEDDKFFYSPDGKSLKLREPAEKMLDAIKNHPKWHKELGVLHDAIKKMLTIDVATRPSSKEVTSWLSSLKNIGDHDFDDGEHWALDEVTTGQQGDASEDDVALGGFEGPTIKITEQ